jgi:hypothetical protein
MAKHSSRRRRNGQAGFAHAGRVTLPGPKPTALLVVCECCDSWWTVVPGEPESATLIKPGVVPEWASAEGDES